MQQKGPGVGMPAQDAGPGGVTVKLPSSGSAEKMPVPSVPRGSTEQKDKVATLNVDTGEPH